MCFSTRQVAGFRNSHKLYHMSIEFVSDVPCKYLASQSVHSIRYLGVTVDSALNFREHDTKLLCARVRKLIYVFKTLRHIAEPGILILFVYLLGEMHTKPLETY